MNSAKAAFVALLCSLGFAQAQDATATAQSPQTQSVRATHAQGGMMPGSSKCNGPIDVASDSFVGNFQTKVGTYIGNVIVTQDECKLRSDKLIAEAVASNDLNRLTATGNVVFNSSSGTATADNGVYEMAAKTITLTGKKVVLVKGKDVMRGDLLVVDMNTGLAHLTARGMPGGRVHSSFIPKSSTDNDSTPKKPKSGAEN
jgi:lipopolysaccharide export system protein LptA